MAGSDPLSRRVLTGRGVAVVAVAAGLAIAGALFGVEELYGAAAATAAMVGATVVWVQLRSWTLDTHRSVRPARVAAGGTVRTELAVRNTGRRSTPLLTVSDPFDGGRWATEFSLAPLRAGSALQSAYRLTPAERGIFDIGPLSFRLTDPMGLSAVNKSGASASRVTVHPRIEPLSPPPVASGSDRLATGGSAIVGQHGDEFFAVREYRSGDDLRRVHWASTARLDELMIRQDENVRRGRVTVFVDLLAARHTRASIEVALAGAASVAAAALNRSIQVRLITSAGVDTGFGTGPGQLRQVLDELAQASAHDGTTLTDLLPALDPGHAGTLVGFTSSRSTQAELALLARLAGSHPFVTVVVDAGHSPDRPAGDPEGQFAARAAGFPNVIWVAQGEPFRQAWQRQISRLTPLRTAR